MKGEKKHFVLKTDKGEVKVAFGGEKKARYKKESELRSKVMIAAVLLNVESELLSL